MKIEDARRQSAHLEKENTELKDKVSRQERYIGRLQDKEKSARRSTMSTTTSRRITRPSTGAHSPMRGSRSPVRDAAHRALQSKHGRQSYGYGYSARENNRPNTAGSRLQGMDLPQSPITDEAKQLCGSPCR